ncbi:MAG: preprotein translocase subunit SecA, partial [Patescibacteria group bacterium]
GAHLITVNDYLAEIGVGWMGPVYHFLGLKTAVTIHDKSKFYNPDIDSEEKGDERLEHFEEAPRKEAYMADITYGTNNEFGFDYLRDNMVQDLSQMAQRTKNAHQYAIVDEADSILIDEARTPLIISAPDSDSTSKYYEYSHMIKSLTQDQDFKVDEKARSVTLTDLGVKRIEQKLKVSNLYEESFDTIHHVESALKAKVLYLRDKEYIVRDNQVIIVDEHTGRLMFGRRYSDGLHQAIEAKEAVPIQQESRTLATISIQNYFRMYKKLSGMTGTAATEAEEFKKIYDMDVLIVPTNKVITRDDRSDIVYKTTSAKYTAIASHVTEIHTTGQPILIGTRSIEHNQIVSNFLKRKKVPHQVLNAKNHEKEAFIISDAGKKGAITVATNIAGRGVDIVLGGAKPELKEFRKKTKSKKISKDVAMQRLCKELSLPPSINPNNYKLKEYAKALDKWQKNNQEVIKAGGLYVLGTERHESRRIDNQLRGRSGRQGDPGVSQFYLSLEDEIMRIFGGEQISKLMDLLKIEEDQPIEHSMVGKAVESAQVKVEGFFFDQRKRLVEFDDVMNTQREIVYKRRRRLLELTSEKSSPNVEKKPNSAKQNVIDEAKDQSLREQILSYVHDDIQSAVSMRAPEQFTDEEFDAIIKEFVKIIPFDNKSQKELLKKISDYSSTEEITKELYKLAKETYSAKEKATGSESMRVLERIVTLSTIDEKWMDHLDAMDSLRDGIWLRGDKQTVLSEYKKEGFSMFESLMESTESTIASRIFRAQTSQQPIRVQAREMREEKDDIHESLSKEVQDASVPKPKTQGDLGDLAAALGKAKGGSKADRGSKKIKIGRNDPCPCGSGKKYKKCGLIKAANHKG